MRWLRYWRLRLVDDWRHAWKWGSMRFGAVGAALYAAFLTFPEHALSLWGLVPAEARGLLPPGLVRALPLVLMVLALIARPIALQKGKRDGR